jgi:hypothetical protein
MVNQTPVIESEISVMAKAAYFVRLGRLIAFNVMVTAKSFFNFLAQVIHNRKRKFAD